MVPCSDSAVTSLQMKPRVGTFEVSFQGVLLFSKLTLKKWPHIPTVSKRMAGLLDDVAQGADLIQL
jgi:hypothetical protein